jgi:hypothetical protein
MNGEDVGEARRGVENMRMLLIVVIALLTMSLFLDWMVVRDQWTQRSLIERNVTNIRNLRDKMQLLHEERGGDENGTVARDTGE